MCLPNASARKTVVFLLVLKTLTNSSKYAIILSRERGFACRFCLKYVRNFYAYAARKSEKEILVLILFYLFYFVLVMSIAKGEE